MDGQSSEEPSAPWLALIHFTVAWRHLGWDLPLGLDLLVLMFRILPELLRSWTHCMVATAGPASEAMLSTPILPTWHTLPPSLLGGGNPNMASS